MPRPKLFLVGLAALSLAVVGVSPRTTVAKPLPPPPPPPKIVAMVSGGGTFRAIVSDGAIYDVGVAQQVPFQACTEAVTSAVLVGRLFPSAPASPIAAVMYANNGLIATLENGDAWFFYESCCVSCYRSGFYMGNIFTVAGTGASAPALAPQSAAGAGTELRNAVGTASPNPARGPVRITYTTAKPGLSLVRVFDASGRLVRTLQSEHGAPGSYSVGWDGRDEQGSQAASGAYFYQVRYPDGSVSSKSIVLAR
jgi:hypothetical protein